ncbi:alpha/beta hydrolase [bacterium]|nr:alpha/beta hydrolase [bacterium]
MTRSRASRASIFVIAALAAAIVASVSAGCSTTALAGKPGATVSPKALAALAGDAGVKVELNRWAVFAPASGVPSAGFIFYPGGNVDWRAYAPSAREIARAGFLVVIAPMPLNLAVFDANAADSIIAAFPNIGRWAIGGHSLGGVMAARYAGRRGGKVAGLILWASYPAKSDDLSKSPLRVASISGARDGLSTPAKIAASRALLPPSTIWTVIEGGNHAQFGWYGPQKGDNEAAIAPEAQQDAIVAASVALLKSLE